MPREKHDSSSEDSDSGSSSNGDGHSDSANSSSEIEDKPRFGPKSTVEKVGTPSKDKDKEKGRSQEEGEKSSPPDNGDKEKSKEKRDDQNSGRLKKRSRSQSPRSRDNKRFKDERSHDRGSNRDRRDDRDRRPRDDRDSERDRGRRHESGRHRVDDKRRDDDRRDDRSRRDGGRDRYDRRSDRDGRDDRRSDRDGGDRRRDRDDRDKDKGEGRREEIKEIKKEDENDSQKRKGEEMNGDKPGTTEAAAAPPQKKVKDAEDIMTRTGGAYIPPAKLRMMQAQITDRSSVAYQRMAWEALKKSINGQINKVNVSNIVDIVRELFQENIVRGRGLLARAMIQAQAASPTFTHVYAALVAIINTKFPQIGELILQRLVYQFKRGFKRNDKNQCLASTRFIAHLVNQQVAHEVVSLEILTLLLENATEDSVEVAISFLKECGQKLSEVSPRGINAIFERLRSILHEGQLDKRVQYMVEVMFATRKDGFKSHPAVISDLDLVEEDDQFTHLLQLDDVTTGFEQLNIFKQDDDYLENEEKYKELKKEILAEGSSDEEGSGDESGSEESSDDDDDDDDEKEAGKQEIVDQTETNMVHLRRTIYLTIQSSLDFEECAHKLLKMELKPGQEVELCYMILDCCAQLRTYEKFFGLLAQRFCQLDKKYVEPFQTIFREQFETIHRLDTNKLRNVAKLFAHLLHTDSISWGVMQCMKLTEEDTTSASRIFIKILFLELSEYLGLPKLNKRLRDPTLQEFFEGILPRQNPKDTRFAVNFFTTIGLGGLTEDLREHLKGLSKQLMQQKQQQEQQLQMKQKEADSSESDSSGSDSSNSDSSDSSSGSSDSSDSESDSSSDSDASKKKKRKKKVQQQKPGSKKSKGKEKQSRGQEDRGGQRKADRPDSRRQDMQQERGNRQTLRPEREVNGRQTSTEEGRPSIKDKLLQLSLPQGMSLVDPHEINRINRINQISPTKRGGRNKKVGKGRRRDRRARRGSNHNSDRDLRGSGSFDFEQGSDREQVYLRSEMDDMDRRRGMSPPPSMRPGRQGDNYDAMERRGGRLDMSPPPALGRNRDRPSEDYPRSGRPDRDLSPHMRGMDRRGASPPAMRQDRRMDYESPPRRLDMDEPRSRGYDRRMDNLPPPRQGDHRSLDSPPPRYQIDRDLDSPRGPRRHDALTPPLQPRGSRRDMESPPPPRRMDSPPRRAALRGDMERERDMLTSRDEMDRGRDIERRRAADVDRSLDRGRGELERAGRGDLDRGVRGDGDRSLDRMRVDDRMLDRGDLERGREPEPRRRDLSRDPDRGRDTGPSPRSVRDLDRGRSGGRAESPRMVHRSPPPPSRREAHHNDLMRDGDRRRGGGDLYESEGKGRIRSVSPVVRKSRSRNEDGGMARQRSLSRERDDRRKGSGRTEQDVSREGGRNKRRR